MAKQMHVILAVTILTGLFLALHNGIDHLDKLSLVRSGHTPVILNDVPFRARERRSTRHTEEHLQRDPEQITKQRNQFQIRTRHTTLPVADCISRQPTSATDLFLIHLRPDPVVLDRAAKGNALLVGILLAREWDNTTLVLLVCHNAPPFSAKVYFDCT